MGHGSARIFESVANKLPAALHDGVHHTNRPQKGNRAVKVTPVAPPAVGNFDPEKVLWAIHRGAKCNVDITHQWNFWPLMALPVQQARARCALMAKLPEGAAIRKVA